MRNDVGKKTIKQIGIITLFCVFIPLFFIGLAKIPTFTNTNKIRYGIENFGNYAVCLKEDIRVNNDFQPKLFVGLKQNRSEKGIISTFSTDYSASTPSRKHNIRLALSRLDNVIIHSGEELSFNEVVGKRTEERGYQKALVIYKGSYTEGVGGGVCQVSSTLYNAWLLAGLDVVSVQAHTLPATYVDLSRDATVSEWIDLVLKNPTNSDVRIKTSYTEDNITISIEGKKREYEYSLKSEILKVIPPEEEVYELDEIGINEYFEGKNGYQSRLVLVITEKGKTIAKRIIRKDCYKPQNIVKILRKSALN